MANPLTDVRFVVGIAVTDLGPRIVAPVQNILSMVASELDILDIRFSPEVWAEVERLKVAITQRSASFYAETDEDNEEIIEDEDDNSDEEDVIPLTDEDDDNDE